MDGFLSLRIEIEYILKNEKPETIRLTETKLSKEIDIDELVQESHAVRRKDRKSKKGGVLLLTGTNIEVDEHGNIRSNCKQWKIEKFILAYVPPKAASWIRDDYNGMMSDSPRVIKSAMEHGSNPILIGDCNSGEVN